MIFGRNDEHYNHDWYVKINTDAAQETYVAENITRLDAIRIYTQLISELENKEKYIEVVTDVSSKVNDEGKEYFIKDKIVSIEYGRS